METENESKVLQFPNFDVQTWRRIEENYRFHCRAAGACPALEDHLITRVRRLYENYFINQPATKEQGLFGMEERHLRQTGKLIEEILDLEVKLWCAGAPAPVDPGPINNLHVVRDS